VEQPETRYAKTVDGVHIAYQVAGNGPMDLVVVASGLGMGTIWDARRPSTFPMAFAAFSRLILLDRRGTGLSDHTIEREQQLALGSQMEDVRAVMDAVKSERAVLAGFESASPWRRCSPARTPSERRRSSPTRRGLASCGPPTTPSVCRLPSPMPISRSSKLRSAAESQ
jgi:hypothetical protein